MRLAPQDLKAIVDSVGKLVDARAKTTEINLQAEIKTSEKSLRGEIREAKNELRTEMHEIKHALKADINNLRDGVAKKLVEHENRLEKLGKLRKSPLKN